jgi:RNA polymerase sigma-70 factor, ECF subfamily
MLQADYPVTQPQSPKIDSVGHKLLKRAQRGEQAAFAELVRMHQAMVFSLAHHSLRNRAVAEELAQEVFLHLYQNLAALESPDHVKNWLRRVTSHRCIDYVRRNRAGMVDIEDIAEPSVAHGSHDVLLQRTLRRYVASLPATPRLVVTLRYQEDLEPTEIAQVLDMPLNTVKSHLRRSLAVLREKVARNL